MDINYIPVDLGDPDISSKIATYLLEDPVMSVEYNLWNLPSTNSMLTFPALYWKNCTPLVNAVNQLCSWENITHIQLTKFLPDPVPVRAHQDKTNSSQPPISGDCYPFALNFPILNCEPDVSYVAFYDPLPGQTCNWPDLLEQSESYPTMLFLSNRYIILNPDGTSDLLGPDWSGPGRLASTSWRFDQITEIDRLYTPNPYQPVLFNISTIHAAIPVSNLVPLWLSVRVDCDLVEKYNLLKK